jgi:hypothetical protein
MAIKVGLNLGHVAPSCEKIKQQHNLEKTKRLNKKELGNEQELNSFIV